VNRPRSLLHAARRRPSTTATILAAVLGILLPFWVGAFWLTTLVFILIYALGALGLDVLTGRTGQVSLGHAAFLLVGAYTAAVLGENFHLTAALWIPAAGLAAGVLGAVIAPLAFRLRGLYLAIVTIGLVYIAQDLGQNWTTVSGGPGGRSLAAPTFGPLNFANGLTIGGLVINESGLYYYLALLLLAVAMWYVRNLARSRRGRDMVSVRDHEVAAAVLGTNVRRTKTMAFVVSSVLAGIAGALYGAYLGFVQPSQFDLLLSIQFVVVIVVGGMGTLWGPLLGAIFVEGLPNLLQNEAGSLPFLAGGGKTTGIPVSDASAIIYGVLLVVFLLLEPRGIVGLAQRMGSLARRRREVPPDQGVNQLTTEG
jgi:branched-chain amino acid transport system permease protein